MTLDTALPMPCCGRSVELRELYVVVPWANYTPTEDEWLGETGPEFYPKAVTGEGLVELAAVEPFASPPRPLAPLDQARCTCPVCYDEFPPEAVGLTIERI